jgi:type I restriction enzyme R subunit
MAECGFGKQQLEEMQRLTTRENSDLFDVLTYIAFNLPSLTREQRAEQARLLIAKQYEPTEQAFIDFVLAHYVSAGVEELDLEKLPPLLKLKYHSLPDAIAQLGNPAQINRTFANFQRYLYETFTAA